MKISFPIIMALAVCGILSACNDDVFVRLPDVENPPAGPDPDDPADPEPVFTDSLYINSFDYDLESIALSTQIWDQQGKSTFIMYDSPGEATILLDNYNNALVIITNSTYYATPWAKEQSLIPMLRFDRQTETTSLIPDVLPFSFGTSSVRAQFMAGERETCHVPADCGVTALVTTSRIGIKARAHISYYISGSGPLTDPTGRLSETDLNVVTWQPIGIRVDWSDIFPAPPRNESSDE